MYESMTRYHLKEIMYCTLVIINKSISPLKKTSVHVGRNFVITNIVKAKPNKQIYNVWYLKIFIHCCNLVTANTLNDHVEDLIIFKQIL